MSEEYGPRGYLPERAAKRARKIILREQMGVGWPVAALGAAVLVALTGVAYVLLVARAPGPPFQAVGRLDAVAAGSAGVLDGVLVVRAGGALRTFVAPDDPVEYCRATRRLEAADGRVWERTGRLVGGDGSSLQPLVSRVHDGVVYVDRERRPPPLPPAPAPDVVPACAGRL
jgi:hypothetical protein